MNLPVIKSTKDDVVKIALSDIYLDESIYPREHIDFKRIAVFLENLRDDFKFDPIEVQACPDKKGTYRILDGAHRWNAYKKAGHIEVEAVIKTLEKMDPLLYSAKMAIGPRQLTEAETRNTARRAFKRNTRLTSAEIGKVIGRSRQAVDAYIADLRAATLQALDLTIFHLNQLGIPQDRIAKRLVIPQRTVSDHLAKMPALAFPLNSDLYGGFTIAQAAEKHFWPEPLVWSQALAGQDDLSRFHSLKWDLRPWDVWDFTADKRFGDDVLDQIPAQVIAHILYFFSNQNDLVFDPMAGGGVCADTCLALNRRCWSLDMADQPDKRPEIEPYYWKPDGKWDDFPLLHAKEKPDLIICDPPSFVKKERECLKHRISGFSKKDYLEFLEKICLFLRKTSKKKTRLAFICTDFRDYENCPVDKEDREQAILIDSYYTIVKNAGWQLTHIIQAPLSPERFSPETVTRMQEQKSLGVTARYVIMAVQS